MPGHIKHERGNTFSEIFLSYHGRIPASEFFEDFAPDAKFKDAAEELGRSVGALYHSLGRIRRWLYDCVNRKLASEGPG